MKQMRNVKDIRIHLNKIMQDEYYKASIEIENASIRGNKNIIYKLYDVEEIHEIGITGYVVERYLKVSFTNHINKRVQNVKIRIDKNRNLITYYFNPDDNTFYVRDCTSVLDKIYSFSKEGILFWNGYRCVVCVNPSASKSYLKIPGATDVGPYCYTYTYSGKIIAYDSDDNIVDTADFTDFEMYEENDTLYAYKEKIGDINIWHLYRFGFDDFLPYDTIVTQIYNKTVVTCIPTEQENPKIEVSKELERYGYASMIDGTNGRLVTTECSNITNSINTGMYDSSATNAYIPNMAVMNSSYSDITKYYENYNNTGCIKKEEIKEPKFKRYKHRPIMLEYSNKTFTAYVCEERTTIKNSLGIVVAEPGEYVMILPNGDHQPIAKEQFEKLYIEL